MAVLTDADRRDIAPRIESVTKQVHPRYAAIMDVNDMAQQLWVWLLGEAEGVKALERYQREQNAPLLATQLRNAAMSYGEGERRANLGYDWRDDYTYSRPEVARLLPLALDPTAIPGMSGSGLHDGPSAKSDPAYGGGMLASIVDVRTAFAKLSGEDQSYLITCVGYDNDWPKVAVFTGLGEKSAYAKYMRILDRMVTRHLGRVTDAA